MEFWLLYLTPQNIIIWLASSIADFKGCSENLTLSTLCLIILTPNVAAHSSKAGFLIRSHLGLWFSLGAHRLNRQNGPPLLGRPKCARLWVCLRILGIIMSDINVLSLLRLQILDYFQFLSLWTIIYFLLLYVSFSFLFQTCMMHKEAHHP